MFVVDVGTRRIFFYFIYAFIKTNKTILAQIIFNLIINSSEALNESDSPPLIRIEITSSPKNIEIIIHDNGPGLNQCEDEQIFTPFFTTKKQGTGLGLSICKNLVHKLNGGLQYLNSDKGATFLIKLPNEYPYN